MNADFLIVAAETAASDGRDAEARGDTAIALRKYRIAARKYREAAEMLPARRKELLALAEKCEKIQIASMHSVEDMAGADTSYSHGTEKLAVNESTGMDQFFTLINSEELKEGFEGVIGLESAKRAVTRYVINPVRYPEEYNYEFLDSNGILLEGPPGTGKTTFAKAVAKEVGLPFALINVASLVNCYVGETGKNIDKVFAYLREYIKAHNTSIIIFFDEFDEIAKKRGGEDKASEASVPALLRNLDGVRGNKGFFILANTNCKDMLDVAILERFSKIINIPLPDEQARKKLFEKKIREVEDRFKSAVDLESISKISDGLSGRDIAFICDDFKRELAEIKAGLSQIENVESILIKLVEERKASKNLS